MRFITLLGNPFNLSSLITLTCMFLYKTYYSNYHELFKSHMSPMNDPWKRWLKCFQWIMLLLVCPSTDLQWQAAHRRYKYGQWLRSIQVRTIMAYMILGYLWWGLATYAFWNLAWTVDSYKPCYMPWQFSKPAVCCSFMQAHPKMMNHPTTFSTQLFLCCI